jgi:predicted amidohydrolase YtcJ
MPTVVYSARRILTMNPNRPFATHVAVRDGRILGAGTLDEELGSIDVAKRADFAILDDDPLSVPPEKLKDVGVWGTMLGGRIFAAPAA